MTPPLTDRTFAAVLFDNDGTLSDSTEAVRRSWTAWAREHDLDPSSLLGFHGVPAAAIVKQVLAPGDHDTAMARIVKLEEGDTEGVVALPGAARALHSVGDCGAIVTSATRRLAVLRLEAAGLDIPEVMVTVDDITRGKPDPEPYLLAAQHLKADPTQCLVVEDAPSGLASAKAAGCATLALLTTTSSEELDADLIVPDLSHVRFVRDADGVRLITG
ncbi:MAG: HAD-IA family hydrolase [Ornithinimicrobium sp.]